MQNIDFSPRVRNRPSMTTGEPAPAPAQQLRRNNRNYVMIFSLLIFAFTLGLLAGVKVGRLSAMDEEVVVQPDVAPDSNSNSVVGFSNEGDRYPYLIRVGSYDREDATRLADKLNTLFESEQTLQRKCIGVTEPEEGRTLAFLYQSTEPQRLNVFLGCFRSPDESQRILTRLSEAGIVGASRPEAIDLRPRGDN